MEGGPIRKLTLIIESNLPPHWIVVSQQQGGN